LTQKHQCFHPLNHGSTYGARLYPPSTPSPRASFPILELWMPPGARRVQRHVGPIQVVYESRWGPTATLICNARVTCMRGNVVPLERGPEDETAPLWRALADPTRRRI